MRLLQRPLYLSRLEKNADQVITKNVITAVSWTAAVPDDYAAFDPAQPTILRIKRAGKFRARAIVNFDPGVGVLAYGGELRIGSSTWSLWRVPPSGGGFNTHFPVLAEGQLAQGDQISLVVFYSDGPATLALRGASMFLALARLAGR